MTIEVMHKDPVPHVTLARVKTLTNITSVDLDLLIDEKNVFVDRVELWMTVKEKYGVHYKSLNIYNLQQV